jgi:preprotein translocase SecE subunit
MASITKNNGENKADEEFDDQVEDAHESQPELSKGGGGGGAVATASGQISPTGGFFHIYKSGQGYWTRMCTVAGAALIILLSGKFIYDTLPVSLRPLFDTSEKLTDSAAKAVAVAHANNMAHNVTIGIVVGVVVGLGLLAYSIMNRPTNVDFLIATDSEMKKVNWTSRAELIGSTKIVVIFVVLITLLLFVIDVVFGYFFWLIGVLKQKPF